MADTPDYELLVAADCPMCGRADTMVAPAPNGNVDTADADCPERVCLNCGTALFVDPVIRPYPRTA